MAPSEQCYPATASSGDQKETETMGNDLNEIL